MATSLKNEEISSNDSSSNPSSLAFSFQSDGPPRGYPVGILPKSKDPDNISCRICHLILRNPVQSPCGHRFCKRCVEYTVRQSSSNKIICQACKDEDETESDITLDTLIPDRGVVKELQRLTVTCCENGCTWSGKFKEYEEHYRDAHDECICPFGCNVKLSGAAQLKAHFTENLVDHINKALERLAVLESSLGNSGSSNENPQLAAQLKNLEQSIKKMEEDIKKSSSGNNRSAGAAEKVVTSGEFGEKFQILDAVMTVLSGEIDKLSQQMDKHEEGIKIKKKRYETLNNGIAKVESLQVAMETKINEIADKVTTLLSISYDGTQMWRINNFKQRREEAKTKAKPYIHSPVFYTGVTGYKLCARLYPNGDGVGLGTHLSLFLVIMRGPYDAILTWPFSRKVTMTVINQSKPQSSRMDVFHPDTTHAASQRPKTDMNTASGLPKFMTITELESDKGFLVDDTLFIKIEIEKAKDTS